jgi:signal transduction histidine kinase
VSTRRNRRRPSIERELPLWFFVLLSVIVLVYATVTYRMVAAATVEAAAQRLEAATRQLGALSHNSVRQMNARLLRVAGSAEVRGLTAGNSAFDSASVAEAIESGIEGPSSLRSVELWSMDGRLLVSAGPLAPRAIPELRPDYESYLLPADSVMAGPLRVFPDSVHASLIAPVTESGRRIGYIVRWARIGNTGSLSEQIGELMGGNAQLYLAHDSDSLMVTLTGEPVPYPPGLADAGTRASYEREGAEQEAIKIEIPDSPWSFVAEIPHRETLAATHGVFRNLAAVAVALLAFGALAAWLLSRRITRPLGEMTVVAESIAEGDYTRRVDPATTHASHDELDRMGTTLNIMADRIQASDQSIREAMYAAEAGSRAKSQFLATISHEIRTPLNAVLGYTDLLVSGVAGAGLTEQQRGYLERVQASGRHLLTLINEVLDLARIEAGKIELNIGTERVRTVVGATVHMIQVQASARGLTLDVHPGHADFSELRFRGDSSRVVQILLNLLSNAVKFTGVGGHIEVSWELFTGRSPEGNQGNWARVSVTDSGSGIEAAKMDTIWEPFVQGEMGHTRAHGGTGLGLAISRRLARLMDGDVTAVSEPGVGSTFTLWLPAAGKLERVPSPEADESARVAAIPE